MESTFDERLVRAVVAGAVLDLEPTIERDEEITAAQMSAWGSEHEVSAAAVRAVLRGLSLPQPGADPRGLRLRGVRIIGRLDLLGLVTPIGLELSRCQLPDGLDAQECSLPRLVLDGSHISCPSGYSQHGAVCLIGSHIGGALSATGATLTNDKGPALYADGLVVDRDAFLDDLHAAVDPH